MMTQKTISSLLRPLVVNFIPGTPYLNKHRLWHGEEDNGSIKSP